MHPKTNSQTPIGYWLKRADEVITKHVNQVLSRHGLTRFHWQVLTIVHEAGVITKAQVFETMETFVDAAGLDDIIAEFVSRGWMVRREHGEDDAIKLELTSAGRDAHRDIFSLQSEVRKRAVWGISEEEYATVIRVLQRMVDNLEQGQVGQL